MSFTEYRSLLYSLAFVLLCLACSAKSANNNDQSEKDNLEVESVLARKFARVGFVNDFAGVMKPEETEKLNASASELLSSNGVDAAIITITSLEGEAIEKVSIEIGRAWKVGAGQRGDGIVLCLAIEDRQSRIDVTRSLEPVLTNEECGLILKKARSWFTQGEYGRGCEEVIRLIKEEITMAERGKEPTSGS